MIHKKSSSNLQLIVSAVCQIPSVIPPLPSYNSILRIDHTYENRGGSSYLIKPLVAPISALLETKEKAKQRIHSDPKLFLLSLLIPCLFLSPSLSPISSHPQLNSIEHAQKRNFWEKNREDRSQIDPCFMTKTTPSTCSSSPL